MLPTQNEDKEAAVQVRGPYFELELGVLELILQLGLRVWGLSPAQAGANVFWQDQKTWLLCSG